MTDIIQLFCLLWRNQIFFSFLFVISFGNNWQVEVLSSNALYNINCYAFQRVTVGGATKKKIKTSKKDEIKRKRKRKRNRNRNRKDRERPDVRCSRTS